MLDDLRDTDFSDLGNATPAVKSFLLGFLLVALLAAGYYLMIKDKWNQLERAEQQEQALRRSRCSHHQPHQ